jgi:hypothetical protein
MEPLDRGGLHAAITTADEKGQFKLVDLDGGVYRLKASRNGYLETSYGARRPGAEGSRIRLEEGQSLNGLTFRLTPGAAIMGTVRDSDGEPLEDAYVVLARFAYDQGMPGIRRFASTYTDDRGEYRFHGLASGKYYVSVEPKSVSAFELVDHSGVSAPSEGSIPTMYPAVTDIASAVPIEVLPGKQVAGIDVSLVRSRVYRVSGRVVNAPGTGSVTLELTDVRNGAVRDRPLRISTRNASGEFEFRGVPPGYYYLDTVANTQHGQTRVDVAAADVEGVRVTLTGDSTIERLQLATVTGEKPDGSRLSLQFAANGKSYRVDNNWGNGGVAPGQYSLVRYFGDALRKYCVKAVRAGDKDVLSDGLAISGGERVQITVTLGLDGAMLEGSVRNAKGDAASGAVIVLVPDDRSRAYLFQNTTSDQRGHYEFSALPRGGYRVFAWDDAEEGIWYDPEFLKAYEKQSQTVVLQPNDRKAVDLVSASESDQR